MDDQFVSSLENTLRQTLTPDSSVIKEASQRLSKEFYPNPLALPALLQILNQSSQDEVRQLAAVEARKLAADNWEKVDGSLKASIKEQLLKGTFQEQNKRLRNLSARVIAAIAEVDLEINEWQDLLPTLISAVQSNDVRLKEVAAFTLYALLESQISALLPHIDDFVTLFGTLIRDPDSKEIRVNAVSSLDAISQIIEDDDDEESQLAEKFKATIPGMVEVLKEVVASDDFESARQVFNVFNSLVLIDSRLVGDHLVSLIQMISELVTNKDLDEEYRVFGLQFLISCVSYRKSKITASKLGPPLTMVALKVATEEVDVEAELENEDEENENEESAPPSLALRLLAVLAAELAPSQVINPLFEALPPLLSSSNQFERRAALLAVGVCSAGAPDYISLQINKIIPAVVQGLKDSELIVRVAALRTLSQLTSELQDLVTDHHEELLPLITTIIDSASSVMAYKYACIALDGLIEFMSHDAMGKYIEPLMHKLFHMLLQANTSTLKTAIVSAIGSTAFASGKAFTPYFEGSVQQLEPFIANSASVEGMSEDDIELRATTFENISTMARAVGSQTFSVYAKPLVEAAYTSLSSEHSRIRESGFAFIANMAKVYGAEFAGFLDQIVPQIITCLGQDEFSFNIEGQDGEDGDDGDDDGEAEDPLKVHTGITIEKEIASVALGELALGTGKEFFKYVEPSFVALADQVENSFGMREAALSCLFKIVRAMFTAVQGKDFKAPKGVPAQSYVDANILALIKQLRDIAIPLLEEEFESTMVASILDGVATALQVMGPIFIVDNPSETGSLEQLCFALMNLLKKEHPSQLEEEEFPEEEESSETEVMLNESALEVLVSLSVALEGDFVKIFTSFKDVILSKFNSKSKPMKVGSVGAIAEMVGGMKSFNPFTNELLKVFVEKLATDKSVDVKGNAAYGIGLLVEYSSDDVSSSFPKILELLFHLLNNAEATQTADDEEAKDVVNRAYANACGCVARLILKNQQAVPVEHVVTPLLQHLPLQTGLEENTPIFEAIIKLYGSNTEAILSQTPKVVEVFAGVFKAEEERLKLVEESTLGREENIDAMKQFYTEGLRTKVVELLKFLNQKYNGIVSQNEVLKSVI